MTTSIMLVLPLILGPLGMGLVLIGQFMQSTQSDSEGSLRLVFRVIGGTLLVGAVLAFFLALADLGYLAVSGNLDEDEVWRPIFVSLLALASAAGGGIILAIAYQMGGIRTRGGQDAMSLLVLLATIVGWTFLILCGWILFLVPVIILVSRLSYENRLARRAQLLWSLSLAVDQKLPLVNEIRHFESTTFGGPRSQANRLRNLLTDGVSLGDALEKVPGLLAPASVTMIRIGEESGTLGSALRAAASLHTEQHRKPISNGDMFWMFLAYVLIIMTMVVSFVMYAIIPKFKKIFWDFGTELPAITETLIYVSDLFVQYWYLGLPLLPLILLVYIIGLYWGWDEFPLSPYNMLFWRRRHAALFRNLALVTAAKTPLSSGLKRLIESSSSPGMRSRLSRVLVAVDHGADVWTTLRTEGLMNRGEAALAQAAQHAGNLSWALNEMASSHERRARHRCQMFTELIQAPAILVVGTAVMFIVVGLFMPLIKLIRDLS